MLLFMLSINKSNMTLTKLKEGELEKIRAMHPDKVPIFVTRASNTDRHTPDISKHKFLIPSHFTTHELLHTIRKWIKLGPEQALYVFINNTSPSSSALLIQLYEQHKDEDGILRIMYACENTFG